MGYVEIIDPNTGKGRHYGKGEAPTEFTAEWCDRCQSWQDLSGGYCTVVDGLGLIWECATCLRKKKS